MNRPLWNNNEIQFARLLCETMATQEIDYEALQESMDLGKLDISELFDRAHDVWEDASGSYVLGGAA